MEARLEPLNARGDLGYSFVSRDSVSAIILSRLKEIAERRLRQAARQAEDLLLVYYAGHGLTAGRRHELYLALRDTDALVTRWNELLRPYTRLSTGEQFGKIVLRLRDD